MIAFKWRVQRGFEPRFGKLCSGAPALNPGTYLRETANDAGKRWLLRRGMAACDVASRIDLLANHAPRTSRSMGRIGAN